MASVERATRFVDYFVISGLEDSSELEPDKLSGKGKHERKIIFKSFCHRNKVKIYSDIWIMLELLLKCKSNFSLDGKDLLDLFFFIKKPK